MNFSHGEYEYHQSVIDNTRKVVAGERAPQSATRSGLIRPNPSLSLSEPERPPAGHCSRHRACLQARMSRTDRAVSVERTGNSYRAHQGWRRRACRLYQDAHELIARAFDRSLSRLDTSSTSPRTPSTRTSVTRRSCSSTMCVPNRCIELPSDSGRAGQLAQGHHARQAHLRR